MEKEIFKCNLYLPILIAATQNGLSLDSFSDQFIKSETTPLEHEGGIDIGDAAGHARLR